jgi:enoyl-[acyl-carrier protein] reductase II
VQEGDAENGCYMAGQIAGMMHKEQSCAEIIQEMESEALSLLEGGFKWGK